jgi:hypothetical protein
MSTALYKSTFFFHILMPAPDDGFMEKLKQLAHFGQ